MSFLFVVFIGFGLVLGIFSRRQALRKLGKVLIMGAFLPAALSFCKDHLYHLPLQQKLVIFIFLFVIFLFALFRFFLNRDVMNDMKAKFLYDGLKFTLTFPFKIIRKILRSCK